VRPDPERRFLAPADVRARLRAASALGRRAAGPVAPGTSAILDAGARVRVVLLDLDQEGEGVGGVVTAAHEAFLDAALDGAGERWVIVATHQPLRKASGGDRLLDRLDRAPRMLAALAGDTHRHRVTPRPGPAGGFWLVETAALADFPQQGRLLRVRETPDGGAVLESELVDTAPDPLADTARELAFLDAQGGRPGGNAGRPADGNVRLFRPAPR
jgi:predicted RNA-binding Zn ribbon-like protein